MRYLSAKAIAQVGQLAKRTLVKRHLNPVTASAVIVAVTLAIGCDSSWKSYPPTPPATEPPTGVATTKAAESRPEVAPQTTAPIFEKEHWDAYFFGSDKVGYSHTLYERLTQDGEPLRRITAMTELSLRRFGQEAKQQIRYVSLEKLTGEVVRFESAMPSSSPGASELTTIGNVEDGRLTMTISEGNTKQSSTVAWDASCGGFFALDQTLEQKPLQAGETRSLKALMPGFNQVAELTLLAIGPEATELLDGKQELLRVEAKVHMSTSTLEQTLWIDDKGVTRKAFMPALSQTSYRTTKEVALGDNTGSFDLGERTIVKVAGTIERPHQLPEATYRLSLKTGDPAQSFASSATQLVRRIDENTIELRVRSLTASNNADEGFPADPPPADGDSRPNSLVQSDDPQIIALAGSVAADTTDKLRIAMELEKLVKQHVSNKSFSQALSSASEVLRSREGDCTEHAVLLAALCRARQIPSRVAIGLVYFEPVKGFAYHMWTEVWDGARWVPLDATLGLGGIGAGHLKVSSSNLDGVTPLTQFLPVFQLLGNLDVEVVSAEHVKVGKILRGPKIAAVAANTVQAISFRRRAEEQ